MINFADVIVDLQYGDTGKGKITHHLAKKPDYNCVLRYNGGSNAGHTVYHGSTKIVTHQVPLGILYGKMSIIGPGCVVNIDKLLNEIHDLNQNGFTTSGLLYIDRRAHVVMDHHVNEDSSDEKIGTTRQGIGPAYKDKYGRTGTRIGDLNIKCDEFEIVDIYEFLHNTRERISILCEGAQGFYLDIDWGDYPYVTSSHCTVGSVCLNGIPPHKIDKVLGIMKAYETYVGNRTDYTDENDPDLAKIQQVGNEFGATTGRPRKVNWLNLDRVIKAIKINGVTNLIINKSDILMEVGVFKFYFNNDLVSFNNFSQFSQAVEDIILQSYNSPITFTWSSNPYGM